MEIRATCETAVTRNRGQVSSRLSQPAIRRAAGFLLLVSFLGSCGGRAANTDPLASITEAVSENELIPPPLTVAWSRRPGSDAAPLTLRPAVSERHVFLVFGDRLEAWSTEDGTPEWEMVLDSEVSAAPAVTGDRVIVATTGDDDGAPAIWSITGDLGSIVDRQTIEAPAKELAALQDTVVYADAAGATRLGRTAQWRIELEGVITVTASESHGLVFVSTADGRLLALDAGDGSERWSYAIDATERLTRPAIGTDLVYVGGTDGQIVALRVRDGQTAWTQQIGIDIVGAPAVAGEYLWVAGLDAALRGLRATNGTKLYTLTTNMSRNYLDMTSFGVWAVVGPRYGPWLAVRGPTRSEQAGPTQVRAPNSPLDLELPPASGPAGVAVVNGDGTVMFMRPERRRQPFP